MSREQVGVITAPSTDAARQWSGWGTALKPAAEFWWLVRKPLGEKTVAANVLKHGTGAINVNGARVAGVKPQTVQGGRSIKGNAFNGNGESEARRVLSDASQGRFPANLVLSHTLFCDDSGCAEGCAVKELDGQSGLSDGARKKKTVDGVVSIGGTGAYAGGGSKSSARPQDSGGASRFFYCAKASKSDRGTENTHPTVKSTALMRYLIRLVTPPGGIVLDPFAGSGSTGVAAKAEGFGFCGIEREAEYHTIAERRLAGGSA